MRSYLQPLVDAIAECSNTTELASAVDDFIQTQEELTTMQRLHQAFDDAGHDALSDIIATVLVAFGEVDKHWSDSELVGQPSVTNYADVVAARIADRYQVAAHRWSK